MVKARDITIGIDEDITGLVHGDAHLNSIYNNLFKCINLSCNADLILCSIRTSNLVPPYFRTSNSEHVQNCPAALDSEGESFEASDVTKRRNGFAAFNKVLRNLTNAETKKIAVYNWATKRKNIIYGGGTTTSRNKARVLVGPVLYDETIEMQEGITYKIQGEDIRNNFINVGLRGGSWINLSGVGILIPINSILSDKDDVTDYEIIIISNWIGETQTRRYIKSMDWIVKRDGVLLETYIKGVVTTY